MKRIVTLLLAAFALWAAAPSASLAQQFGCACMHNQTGQTIHFRYKWGNEDWRTRQVFAGNNYAVCWRYGSGPHTSPPLLFQLDRDMGPGAMWTTYTINRGQSQQANCAFTHPGMHYNIAFQPGTNNAFIHVTHRVATGAPPPQPGPGPMPGPGPGPAPGMGQFAFGCACLNNQAGIPINFRYRLGNQPWKPTTLLAGNVYSFCTPFGAGPQTWLWLHFQVDRDMTAGNAWTDYTIARVGSASNQCGLVPRQGHYFVRFQPGTNNQFLQITR